MKTKLGSEPGIPLGRAAQVHPFIDFLDDLGARTEVGLERNKLPPNLRECPEMLASTRAMFAFVGAMAQREGIEDIGWRAPRREQLSPRLLRQFDNSPTLLRALEQLCRYSRHESSHAKVWFEERGDSLLFCHRGSLEIGALGSDAAHTMQSAVLVSIVRSFTNADWVPAEIGLATKAPIGSYVREALGGARIHRTPDHGWLRLSRAVLCQPPQVAARAKAPAATGGVVEPAHDLVGSLGQLLRPYLSMGAPPVHVVANLAGRSPRSLQRELTLAGTSYRDIAQRIKFDAARDLLQRSDAKILEIAHETGFKEPPHFSRFFRRLAGMTPREYRATFS